MGRFLWDDNLYLSLLKDDAATGKFGMKFPVAAFFVSKCTDSMKYVEDDEKTS